MRIRKTSQYIEGGATLSNTYGTSQSDGYSQEYVNNTIGNIMNEVTKMYKLQTGHTYRFYTGWYETFRMFGIYSTTQFAGYFVNTPNSVSNHLLYGTPSITFTDIGSGYQTLTIPTNSTIYLELGPNMTISDITTN